MFVIGLICGVTIVVLINMFLDISNKKQESNELECIKSRLELIEDEIRFDRKSNGTNLSKVIKDIAKLKEHLSYMSNNSG
jgi:uncharacterized membrane-anchored protein YhcB (DUF1043 family)